MKPTDQRGSTPPDMVQRIRAFGRSPEATAERALAAGAPPPRPEELAALAAGELSDPARRQTLARQVLWGRDGPRQLAALGSGPTNLRPWSRPSARMTSVLLAVAAALALWILGPFGRLPADALRHARFTDPSGLELRGEAEGARARLLVAVHAAGMLALLRVDPDGSAPSAEAVRGDQLWVRVLAGEEVLLPLDRAIEVQPGERWVALLAPEALDRAATAQAVQQALAGERPGQAVAQVVTAGR